MFFVNFSVDKVWVIDIITVTPEYTKRGLANQMTAKVLRTAKERGFTIALLKSTSAYTRPQKINRFGFGIVLEKSFSDNYANYSEMTDEIKKSHQSAAVLVKVL